jgi:hypothetical protein
MSFLSRSYPYPFLGREGDFENSTFEFEVEPQLGAGDLILNFSTNILDSPLAEFLKSGQFKFGLDIHCPEVFQRSFEALDLVNNSLSIPAANLAGEVRLTPVCVSNINIHNYQVSGANKEFKGGEFQLFSGDVVGAGETTTFFIRLDKANPKSPLRIELDPTMEPFDYRFELGLNQIAILMGVNARAVWESYYSNSETKPFLMLSILKDCLLFAMQDIVTSDDRDSMYWSRHFIETLERMGIEIDESTSLQELNRIAQSLISDKGIKALFERISN